MDRYLQKCPEKQELKDLHLIGVTTMFSAAKYEEIHPLKLGLIY
jgi:cyclin A